MLSSAEAECAGSKNQDELSTAQIKVAAAAPV
jgi:hypothetical protein